MQYENLKAIFEETNSLSNLFEDLPTNDETNALLEKADFCEQHLNTLEDILGPPLRPAHPIPSHISNFSFGELVSGVNYNFKTIDNILNSET